jgi:hypothetical protein
VVRYESSFRQIKGLVDTASLWPRHKTPLPMAANVSSDDWFTHGSSDYQEKKIIQPKIGSKSLWYQR